ncbi:MAG: hypothetical protein ACFFG0_28535, partial [Candidatus Thorarchaeota archaeon]
MKKNNIVITFLVLLFFSLILFHYIYISHAMDSGDSLLVPLKYQIFECSDQKGTINNISTIDIDLPSSTWSITDIEMNFTNIDYFMSGIETIEDTPTNDDFFLNKHDVEGLGVQIKLNDTTTISGVYLNIKTISNHTLDDVDIKIRGYNSSINAPNITIYGREDLNYTMADGWNYQKFLSPISLSRGNYFLVIEGYVHAAGEYHWYYNDLDPNNPDLYRSENYGFGWINGTQGSPFLYKLVQKVKKRDVYPKEFNMTAEINGDYHKILNSAHGGSGYLKLSGIEFSPNNVILHILIKNTGFLFNLNYYLKLKNQFLSNAFVTITENDDNSWKIVPDINRCNYNYSVKIKLPSNWYNIIVFKDNIDITASESILINGNSLYILNDTINGDTNWEITANSPKIDFSLDLSRGTKFQLDQELVFSAIAPTR